jgi:hypothetical protein
MEKYMKQKLLVFGLVGILPLSVIGAPKKVTFEGQAKSGDATGASLKSGEVSPARTRNINVSSEPQVTAPAASTLKTTGLGTRLARAMGITPKQRVVDRSTMQKYHDNKADAAADYGDAQKEKASADLYGDHNALLNHLGITVKQPQSFGEKLAHTLGLSASAKAQKAHDKAKKDLDTLMKESEGLRSKAENVSKLEKLQKKASKSVDKLSSALGKLAQENGAEPQILDPKVVDPETKMNLSLESIRSPYPPLDEAKGELSIALEGRLRSAVEAGRLKSGAGQAQAEQERQAVRETQRGGLAEQRRQAEQAARQERTRQWVEEHAPQGGVPEGAPE